MQPTRIGTRFEVEAVLGKGGMAVVYLVHDDSTGQRVALKQLRCDKPALRERVTNLFQQEYATLSGLHHPNIVRVFDYGLSNEGPYYTMELLAGDELHSVQQLGWRELCVLLRDVASALALLHSRRLVHRDVTPRNVRRGPDGRAKLIDFGALSPMGEFGLVIGTPPFVPPELLHGQPLDGRADLYSLGALAYRLLTGHHAYPARTIPELPERWTNAPPPIESVPPKLSALVLSMLSLDVLGRPSTAWEVISRLSAIADLPPDDDDLAQHAYLVMPQLVGRVAEVERFRSALRHTLQGTGSIVWALGEPGSGRSRLLASFALEARLSGVPVIRASGDDGDGGPFAAVRSLVEDQRLLSGVGIPVDIDEALSRTVLDGPPESRSRSFATARSRLVQWIVSLAQPNGLVITIDDPQRLDSASATLLGELVHVVSQHKILLALAVCAEDGPIAVPWIGLLQRHSDPLVLRALDLAQVEDLIRSMFGDAAHLRPLATALHRLSLGNPGACIGLAQHLLEQGYVRYESGRWMLPADVRDLNLPDNLSEALARRLSQLRPVARELANALSLVDPLSAIRAHHYAALLPEDRASQFHAALAELISADIVRARGETYVVTHPALALALQQTMPERVADELHLRLADLYAAAPYEDLFMQSWHLHQAGRADTACDILVRHAAEVNAPDQVTRGSAKRSRGYYRFARSVYEASLDYCERIGAPPRAKFELRRALVYLAAYLDPQLVRHAIPLVAQLRSDTGLVHWDAPNMPEDPATRIMMCLARANQEHEAREPELRCCTPMEAVRVLAHIVSVLAGAHSRMLDVVSLEALPDLIEPLRPLAPPLRMIAETVQSCRDAAMGLETTQRCIDLIASIEANPDTQGDEVSLAIVHALRYYVGVWEARHGGDDALRRAADIEQDVTDWETRFPYHTGLGRYRSWHVRRLGHLYNGNADEARLCRERIELLQLDDLDPLVTPNLRTGVYMEARAHALVGSLGELRSAVDVIEGLAVSMPTWEPVMHWARGEYHKLREDFGSARTSFQAALARTVAGRSVVWSWCVVGLAETELLAGDVSRSLSTSYAAIRDSESVRLPLLTRVELDRVRLLAEAQAGTSPAVGTEFDHLIERVRSHLGGVPLGRLFEARAHIAAKQRDLVAFDTYAQLADDLYRPGRHPSLIAKLDSLHAMRRTIDGSAPKKRNAATLKLSNHEGQRLTELVRAAMSSCVDYPEVADNALGLLMDHAQADAGYLLTFQGTSFNVTARIDAPPATDDLIAYANDLANGNLSETTVVSTERPAKHHTTDRRFLSRDNQHLYLPLLIDCESESAGVFSAVVMLRLPPNTQPRIPVRMTEVIREYLVATYAKQSTPQLKSG